MVPSLSPFVWLNPQKGEKLSQSESSKGYSEAFHYYITFTYFQMYILFPPLIICLKASFVRNMWVKFQDYAKVFLPSDIQIRMAFCKIFKRCFLLPSLLPKYSDYLRRCFGTISSARTSAWASQSSGSHIRCRYIFSPCLLFTSSDICLKAKPIFLLVFWQYFASEKMNWCGTFLD